MPMFWMFWTGPLISCRLPVNRRPGGQLSPKNSRLLPESCNLVSLTASASGNFSLAQRRPACQTEVICRLSCHLFRGTAWVACELAAVLWPYVRYRHHCSSAKVPM